MADSIRKRDAQREATRARVIEAAERRFGSQGFEATTIRQIAEDAHVSVGTVMATGDKDGLLVAIFDGWISAVHAARAGDGPVDAGSDLGQTLLEVFRPFVAYFAGDEDLARQYAAIVVRGRHETAIFHDLGDSLVAELTARLETTAHRDPAAAARTIYLAYLGVLMRASNGAITVDEAMGELGAVIRYLTG